MSKKNLPMFLVVFSALAIFFQISNLKVNALEAQPAQEAVTVDEITVSTPIPTVLPSASPIIKPTATPTSTAKPTPTPTAKPTQTPAPLPLSISTPKPTASPTPKPSVTPSPTTSVTYLQKQDYIMNAINNYRASQGLYPVKRDSYTCNFAKIRAKEISTNFSHDGFRSRINNGTLPYPSFRLITENIAMTYDYKRVVPMWINSEGHALNMRRDTPYVCVEFYGNYYAYEGWKP